MPDLENGPNNGCPFCSLGDREIVASNGSAIAFYDGFPVSKGHALVVSRRHATHYFELNQEEKTDLWRLVDEIAGQLRMSFEPDGFNVGFNVQEAGGQTVFHTHIHVIPRYKGDVPHPRGGVRHVIPKKGNY